MTTQLHVRITGRVQGVGFRDATTRQARALGLTGWVRNSPTGDVEAVFEGPRDVLEKMLRWCENGPSLADVRDVDAQWDETDRPQASFRVRH